MLVMAIVALVWANSPFGDSYVELWETIISFHVGDLIHIDLDLRGWVNDLAMAIFFFVVTLDQARDGSWRACATHRGCAPRARGDRRHDRTGRDLRPVQRRNGGSGRLGNPDGDRHPFAVGVLSLLGRRVPSSLVVFLLTLAIVDDLGAILVIAVFYTSGLSFGWLAVGIGCILAAVVLNRVDVRSFVPYFLLAAFCWLALHESGVHATLAGVAFGLVAPVTRSSDRRSSAGKPAT